jgi:hypothetical protein
MQECHGYRALQNLDHKILHDAIPLWNRRPCAPEIYNAWVGSMSSILKLDDDTSNSYSREEPPMRRLF